MVIELSQAEQLYEKLRSQYENPFADRTSEVNRKRLLELYGYYRRGFNDAEKVLELLEKHAAERELGIFCLLLALEEPNTSEEAILLKFQLTLKSLGKYKPRLMELIKSQFWMLPFGIFKVRPYNENQI